MPTSKFNMSDVCKRANKRLKAKCGKKVNNSFIRKFWKDYIELSVIPILLKYGKIKIDKNCSLEIVGEKKIKLIKLKRNGKLSSTTLENKLRAGIVYKIVLTDNSYKHGSLIFQANKTIKEAVTEALMNTNTYYRIVV